MMTVEIDMGSMRVKYRIIAFSSKYILYCR